MLEENFKNKIQKKDLKKLETLFIKACSENNVELVDYLLFSNELKDHPTAICRNYQGIRDAANQGSYEVIEYLLNNSKINKKQELITCRKQVLIRNACFSGNLKLVKFLLETPGIKEYINLEIDNYKSFEQAIYSFHKELVFYLFDNYKEKMSNKASDSLILFFRRMYKDNFFEFSKKLMEHNEIKKYAGIADQTANLTEFINNKKEDEIKFIFTNPITRDNALKALDYGSVKVAMQRTELDILKLLIIDLEIPLTEVMKDFLNTTDPRYDTYRLKKVFENRELTVKLDNNLSEKKKIKGVKI